MRVAFCLFVVGLWLFLFAWFVGTCLGALEGGRGE